MTICGNLTKRIAILHSYGHHFRYHVDMRMSRKHLERAAACLAKENRPVFRLSFATQGSSFPQLQICHAPCRTFLHPLCHFKLPTWKPGKRSTFGCVLLMKQNIGKDVTNVLDFLLIYIIPVTKVNLDHLHSVI